MLVHTDTRKIVLKIDDAMRVMNVIPSAKQFHFQGHDLIAVPHNLDETKVLRNLGIYTPSPIRSQYQWSGQYTPMKHQLETCDFLSMNRRAFCLLDMGLGKTLCALWTYDYLRSIGAVKSMLVISPLSTLEPTWANEVFRHFPHLTFGVLHGSKDRRDKLLAENFDVYLINHDGIKTMLTAFKAKKNIDVVVVDEIASFRNAKSDRWKALSQLIAAKPWVWGLTGTPTPNGPEDAWAQVRLISPERVTPYSGQWRDQTMRQISAFKWLPKENATDIVAAAMQPAIRFKREEVIDLPPCSYLDRHAPMSPEQASAYKEMLTKLKTEAASSQILAVNEGVKLGKLVQIASGVVYDTVGKPVVLGAKARLDVVIEAIEQSGSKSIVFVPYRGVLEYVAQELGKNYQVAIINGSTPKGERDKIFQTFQHTNEIDVLVAQPAAMSHGLTLTSASTTIWWSPITSHETYAQANARITRPGQRHAQFIVRVEGSAVERKLYATLEKRHTTQGLLLEILENN